MTLTTARCVFNLNTTHFQSTNLAHMSFEVLDLDFVKTHPPK